MMTTENSAKPVLKRFLWALSIYGLLMLNWHLFLFCFSSTRLNYIFFLFIQAIPFLLIVVSLRFPRVWMKVTGIVCLLPMIVVSSLLGFLTIISLPDVIKTGEPALSARRYRVHAPHYDLVVYSGDASFSVWQEKTVVPGILLVRMVHSSGVYDPEVKVLDEDTIKVKKSYPPDTTEEIKLKRWVYF